MSTPTPRTGDRIRVTAVAHPDSDFAPTVGAEGFVTGFSNRGSLMFVSWDGPASEAFVNLAAGDTVDVVADRGVRFAEALERAGITVQKALGDEVICRIAPGAFGRVVFTARRDGDWETHIAGVYLRISVPEQFIEMLKILGTVADETRYSGS